MKSILALSIALLLAFTSQSQTKTFIRIFDETGRKINKGFLTDVSDSSLTIFFEKKTIQVPVSRIANIKLRRSWGHTILVTSAILAGAGAIIGIASADTDTWIGWTPGEGAIGGLALGAWSGTFWGTLIGGTRNRPEFKVDMKAEQWLKVKELLKPYLPATSN
ncbi:MAG TPA: hypothetical protein VI461_00095 [Chitinophagaceae bacterium]|nr:hypothetical protein [Chitinophagaceae bacterium]